MTKKSDHRTSDSANAATPDDTRSAESLAGRSSRRRFLGRTAIAAPAVFTLPSSASAIAFGSVAQCVRNMEGEPDYQHVDTQDDWARREVPGITVRPKGVTWGGSDAEVVLVRYGYGTYIDGDNQRWNRLWNGDYRSPDGNLYERVWRSASRYTVAYVDDGGNLLGVHPSFGKYGRAVTGSCWVSLLPRA